MSAAARWDAALGEYILPWDHVRSAPDPRAAGLQFARAAFRYPGAVCGGAGSAADVKHAPVVGQLRQQVAR